MIKDYFDNLRNRINQYSHIIENHDITGKGYSEDKGYVDGVLVLIDERVLEFSKVKDTFSEAKVKYRHHNKDKLNKVLLQI